MKLFTSVITAALSLAACVVTAAQDAPSSSTTSVSTEDSSSFNSVSVYAVLATALPASLLDLALTNPAEATQVIASEFASGSAPAWFSHLPKDIQTYLVPVTTIKQAPSVLNSAIPSLATSLQTVTLPSNISHPHGNSTIFRNYTTTHHHHNHTMSHTKSYSLPVSISSISTTVSPSIVPATTVMTQPTSSSKAGAAAPTAVIGAGLVGAVGLIGLLAL